MTAEVLHDVISSWCTTGNFCMNLKSCYLFPVYSFPLLNSKSYDSIIDSSERTHSRILVSLNPKFDIDTECKEHLCVPKDKPTEEYSHSSPVRAEQCRWALSATGVCIGIIWPSKRLQKTCFMKLLWVKIALLVLAQCCSLLMTSW